MAEARQVALQGWDEARDAWLSQVAVPELSSGLSSIRALEAEVVTLALKEILKAAGCGDTTRGRDSQKRDRINDRECTTL